MELSIAKEVVAELPVETFSGKIVVVDRENEVFDAVQDLIQHSQLGFDTETKPAFKRGQVNKIALLQLSTLDTCYLFRLNKIGYPDVLDKIICNPEIVKIGLSLRDDFAAIRKRSDKQPKNFIDLQTFVDNYGIIDNGLQRIYAIIFGKKISKNQRLSNWEADILSPAQQQYAAIDAWACLRIYRQLLEQYKNGEE